MFLLSQKISSTQPKPKLRFLDSILMFTIAILMVSCIAGNISSIFPAYLPTPGHTRPSLGWAVAPILNSAGQRPRITILQAVAWTAIKEEWKGNPHPPLTPFSSTWSNFCDRNCRPRVPTMALRPTSNSRRSYTFLPLLPVMESWCTDRPTKRNKHIPNSYLIKFLLGAQAHMGQSLPNGQLRPILLPTLRNR